MNSGLNDPKLRRLFEASRAGDARRAPAFGDLASGRRAAPRTAIRWMRVAAAAAAIVVVGASLSLLHRPAVTAPLQSARDSVAAVDLNQWAACSEWAAPTDSLLATSDLPWGARLWGPTDSLLTPSTLPWGGSISAPTDSLINAVSGETGSTSNNGKDDL